MNYHFSKIVTVPFEQAITSVVEGLKREGFGILTDIDVKETLKNKLGADFRPYRILGACSPPLAYRALQLEDKIGTMLPCNVIVQEHSDGTVEVSAVDPVASMQQSKIRAWRRSRKKFRLSSGASSTDYKLAAVHSALGQKRTRPRRTRMSAKCHEPTCSMAGVWLKVCITKRDRGSRLDRVVRRSCRPLERGAPLNFKFPIPSWCHHRRN